VVRAIVAVSGLDVDDPVYGGGEHRRGVLLGAVHPVDTLQLEHHMIGENLGDGAR
jgi:hypothetical protein